MNKKDIIFNQLKAEIKETLSFLAESDIKIYGALQEGTKQAFKMQKVEIPDKYLNFDSNNSKKQL